MSVGGIGFDPGQRLPPLRDRATAQRCDYPGCPECGNPAVLADDRPAPRYRVGRDGAVGPAVYDRLADAVEVAVLTRGDGGRATIYRETDGGDLWVMARVDGRKDMA